MHLIDLTGKRFGRLQVICRDFEIQKLKKAEKPYWKCLCDCGKEVSVLGKSLRDGTTKSCGCYSRDQAKELNWIDITNQHFENLIAIKYLGKSKWECQCDCGNKTIVSTSHLRSGHTTSCGCLHSKGEKFIAQFLIKKNIHFKKEYTAEGLRNEDGNKLRIDFAILNDKEVPVLFIEYNGKQHYDINDSWYSERLHKSDLIKENYAKINNVPLIIIKYDEDLEFVMSRIDFSKYNNV